MERGRHAFPSPGSYTRMAKENFRSSRKNVVFFKKGTKKEEMRKKRTVQKEPRQGARGFLGGKRRSGLIKKALLQRKPIQCHAEYRARVKRGPNGQKKTRCPCSVLRRALVHVLIRKAAESDVGEEQQNKTFEKKLPLWETPHTRRSLGKKQRSPQHSKKKKKGRGRV